MGNMTALLGIRLTPALLKTFKDKADASGLSHTEVLRVLISEFAHGKITLGVQPTTEEEQRV